VNRQVFRVAWYRFRATFGRRWAGYLAIVLLVGVLGGVAMSALAGARLTQSSFPAFLRSTNPSDMDIDVGPYNPKLISQISHLPQVKTLKSYISLNLVPIKANGTPDLSNPFANLEMAGSINGLYFDQDRVTIVEGHAADPKRVDQIVVNRYSARLFNLRVGQTISAGAYSNAELNSSGYPTGPPVFRAVLHIVGIGVFNDEVIQDEVDRIPRALFTPALTSRLRSCCASYAWSGLQLKTGASDVADVEREYLRLLPSADPYYFHVTSIVEAQGEQAVKPESIALGVFGLIAGLAVLLIGAQAVFRQIRDSSSDREVLHSLGANPVMTATDGILGSIVALTVASLLAGGVAVALSPFELFGPVRSVMPTTGFSFDWTVLGLGTLTLFASLAALTVFFVSRDAPSRRRERTPHASSAVAQAVAASGAPAPVAVGARFALEAGRGRTSVPIRSAILGSLLAVTVTVAAVVFGSSLTTLVHNPPLYGWNWNYALEADAGYADIPQSQLHHLLSADPSVAASSGAYFETFAFDGQAVPVIGMTPSAAVQPAVLSGHGLEGPNQVILGPATLSQLHKKIGDTLVARYTNHRTTLHIVGTATMPAVGIGHGLHLSLGIGAVIDYRLIPAAARNIVGVGPGGPNMVFVRFKDGANPTTARHSLERIASALTPATSQLSVLVVPVQRPAQIVNYQSMGDTPVVLAGALALGAFAALSLTLTASVRRRRRELALFKTLGFTRRQLAAAIAWEASITVGIGAIIGVPLGIVAGRGLWDLFAREFYAIARPTVPVPAVALLAIGALVLANIVAAVPGLIAARTPTAILLRAE
jgi:hypothetical protein